MTAAPGSDAALELGCKCPVMDNGHGKGYMGGVKHPESGATIFVMNEECPLHGAAVDFEWELDE